MHALYCNMPCMHCTLSCSHQELAIIAQKSSPHTHVCPSVLRTRALLCHAGNGQNDAELTILDGIVNTIEAPVALVRTASEGVNLRLSHSDEKGDEPPKPDEESNGTETHTPEMEEKVTV